MTREQKCELAIERGFTYEYETGLIYNRYGKISNHINTNGYVVLEIRINKKSNKLKAHQFAWYFINKEISEFHEIDHINGIRNDNRICNLRQVTHQQNQFNIKNVKGYSWHKKNNKWCSVIRLDSKNIYLGSHNTEQEAHNAYLAAKEIYHKI